MTTDCERHPKQGTLFKHVDCEHVIVAMIEIELRPLAVHCPPCGDSNIIRISKSTVYQISDRHHLIITLLGVNL